MTKIKICGLTRKCDIEAVNQAQPDYIGFVFAESKRRITPQDAYHLREHLDKRIMAVGVFVDEKIEEILGICSRGTIDIIQLHGQENADYIQSLKSESGKPVIKAVRVQSSEDIKAARKLNSDYLLLDAYSDMGRGGTGETFDWSVVERGEKPFFLAGGLNCSNILQAISAVQPFGVDISSGVESDGLKDKGKIIEIVNLVRSGVRSGQQGHIH